MTFYLLCPAAAAWLGVCIARRVLRSLLRRRAGGEHSPVAYGAIVGFLAGLISAITGFLGSAALFTALGANGQSFLAAFMIMVVAGLLALVLGAMDGYREARRSAHRSD